MYVYIKFKFNFQAFTSYCLYTSEFLKFGL